MNVYFDEDLFPTTHYNKARFRSVLTEDEQKEFDRITNWGRLNPARDPARDPDRETSAAAWMNRAFRWPSTPQGQDYWLRVWTRLNKARL